MCKWRVLKILTEEWGFQNTNSQKNKLESLSIVICRTGGINQDTCKGCRNTSTNKRLKLRTIFIASLQVTGKSISLLWELKSIFLQILRKYLHCIDHHHGCLVHGCNPKLAALHSSLEILVITISYTTNLYWWAQVFDNACHSFKTCFLKNWQKYNQIAKKNKDY